MKPGLKYKRGIEVVGSCLIEDRNGKISMARSPAWNNKWIMPAGHIEPGERISDGILREGMEETGLKLKPVSIFYYGEWMGEGNFHRPAHFVFFDLYAKVLGGKVKLQKRELTEYGWFYPKGALKLDLPETYEETINAFIDFKKRNKKKRL